MAQERLDLTALLQAPLQVEPRRVGDQVLLELAPAGQTWLVSVIELITHINMLRAHQAWTTHLVGMLEPVPPAQLSEASSWVASVQSNIRAFANEQESEYKRLWSQYFARMREATEHPHPLTSDEAEADRALCALLGIDPEKLPTDRLNELRKLWV